MEQWKSIKGYEGLYEVSNEGRIKAVERFVEHSDGRKPQHRKEAIRRPQKTAKGYLSVRLSKGNKIKGFVIHRLVAEAFIPNPNKKPQVNHKDGNKTNNHDWNLEWMTNSENIKHAYDNGFMNSRTKKVAKLNMDGTVSKIYDSLKSVEKDGYNAPNVISVCRGTDQRYTHGGFKWKYVEE